MKNYLLIILIATTAACNSNSKKEEKVTDEKTNQDTAIQKPADPVTTTTPPPGGKIDIESFGDIKLGQPYSETVKALGQPGSKATAIEWSADGLMHQDQTWKDKGLVLNISYDKAKAESTMTVFSIIATAPNAFKTRAGMGIGSTYAEVEQAYKRDIEPEATDATQITVGSVYGGIIFSFRNDKVEKIFLGAESE